MGFLGIGFRAGAREFSGLGTDCVAWFGRLIWESGGLG